MTQTVTVSVGLLLALFPVAIAIGGFFVATWYRMNPIQRRRDQMIAETLAAAEQRVSQLQSDVASLERQVVRLREDLHWEREQNRKMRQELASLRPVTIVAAELEQ